MTPEQKIYPGTQREAVIGTQGVSPGEVVAAALTAIQPDGTVRVYDADTDEWTAIAPAAPKPLDCLPADQYYDELFNLRRAIAETILGIVDDPEQTGRQITQLAHHLTAYRHDPAFIEYTTSFLTVDERGVLHWREFPRGSITPPGGIMPSYGRIPRSCSARASYCGIHGDGVELCHSVA